MTPDPSTELSILALIATHGVDIADRLETAGQLVAAAHLRETVRIAETAVIKIAPPLRRMRWANGRL